MVQGLSPGTPALSCAEACSDSRAALLRALQKLSPQDQQQLHCQLEPPTWSETTTVSLLNYGTAAFAALPSAIV